MGRVHAMFNGSRLQNGEKDEPKPAQTGYGSAGKRRILKRNISLEQLKNARPVPLSLLLFGLSVNPAHNPSGKIKRDIQRSGTLFPGAIFFVEVHVMSPFMSFMAA
jgi:hypothetical protein